MSLVTKSRWPSSIRTHQRRGLVCRPARRRRNRPTIVHLLVRRRGNRRRGVQPPVDSRLECTGTPELLPDHRLPDRGLATPPRARSTLSRTDALTGVLNGRAFAEHLEYNLQPQGAMAGRSHSRSSTSTTSACERRLRPWRGQSGVVCRGTYARESLRETDKIARLGGDEFAAAAAGHRRRRRQRSDRARPRTTRTGAERRGSLRHLQRRRGDLPRAPPARRAGDERGGCADVCRERPGQERAVAVGVYDANLGVAVTRSQEPEAVLFRTQWLSYCAQRPARHSRGATAAASHSRLRAVRIRRPHANTCGVSIARVASAGPFSAFHGFQR